jgi:hypothetical protein
MSSTELGNPGRTYIAFRLAEGKGSIAVVATLDPEGGGRFPWAIWYHEQAPHGSYLKAPAEYARLNPETATALIALIQAGQPLPPEFVATLPLVL